MKEEQGLCVVTCNEEEKNEVAVSEEVKAIAEIKASNDYREAQQFLSEINLEVVEKFYKEDVEINDEPEEEETFASYALTVEDEESDDELIDEPETPATEKIYYAKTYIGNLSMRASSKEFKSAVKAYRYLQKKVRKYSGTTYWTHAIEVWDGKKSEEIYWDGEGVGRGTTDAELQAIMDAENAEMERELEIAERNMVIAAVSGEYAVNPAAFDIATQAEIDAAAGNTPETFEEISVAESKEIDAPEVVENTIAEMTAELHRTVQKIAEVSRGVSAGYLKGNHKIEPLRRAYAKKLAMTPTEFEKLFEATVKEVAEKVQVEVEAKLIGETLKSEYYAEAVKFVAENDLSEVENFLKANQGLKFGEYKDCIGWASKYLEDLKSILARRTATEEDHYEFAQTGWSLSKEFARAKEEVEKVSSERVLEEYAVNPIAFDIATKAEIDNANANKTVQTFDYSKVKPYELDKICETKCVVFYATRNADYRLENRYAVFDHHWDARNFVRGLMANPEFVVASVGVPANMGAETDFPYYEVRNPKDEESTDTIVAELETEFERMVRNDEVRGKLREEYLKKLAYTTLAMEPSEFSKLYQEVSEKVHAKVEGESVRAESEVEEDKAYYSTHRYNYSEKLGDFTPYGSRLNDYHGKNLKAAVKAVLKDFTERGGNDNYGGADVVRSVGNEEIVVLNFLPNSVEVFDDTGIVQPLVDKFFEEREKASRSKRRRRSFDKAGNNSEVSAEPNNEVKAASNVA